MAHGALGTLSAFHLQSATVDISFQVNLELVNQSRLLLKGSTA